MTPDGRCRAAGHPTENRPCAASMLRYARATSALNGIGCKCIVGRLLLHTYASPEPDRRQPSGEQVFTFRYARASSEN